MDFGMGPTGGGKKGKKGPEMSSSEKGGHTRGISLETGSPYILPVGLHGSRESFHSLSRSQIDPHDPYRPVTFGADNQSIRSQSRAYRHDNGSLYTTSSGGTEKHRMGDGLLKNAQRMSTSAPMALDTSTIGDIKFPEPAIPLSPLNPRFDTESHIAPLAPLAPLAPSTTSTEQKSANPTTAPTDVPSVQAPEPAATQQSAFPPRIQSQSAVHEHANNTLSIISTSSYGDGFEVTPPSPSHDQSQHHDQYLQPQQHLGVDDFGHNMNRLSLSVRPLPSEDPEENPEQRANRIRSFYKEYFDDSKPEPVGGHAYTDYYEDYGSEYQDGAFFDSRNGNFVVAQPNAPYAEPITRRAMTPPPRAPPRFRSNTNLSRNPHMSNSSMASSQFPPRNMSSMSGRMAAPRPKKNLPPPVALSSLPTPAKLSENSMVFDPIDFAPPVSFRERQNGVRPDSPLGNARPYSPSIRAHTPLVGAYDDLAVMPSPHLLRKSGTFTALDFAPPPRFRDGPGSNASDAGSIRSNRSGMSAAGKFAVRSGANRVSRIPKGVVGTRDDFLAELRPQMNMVSRG